MRRKVFFLIRILITLSIFLILFKFIPYHQLIEAFRDAQKHYLFYAFLIFWISLFVAIARWRFLLLAVGIKTSFREIIYSYFSGLFLNLFIPSVVAGDFFRGFSLFSRHGKLKEVTSTILLDRFAGGFALTLVAIIGFLLLEDPLKHKEILTALSVLLLVIFFLTFFIFSRTFFSLFLKVFRRNPLIYGKASSLHSYICLFKKNQRFFVKL